jgi:hypothetical protein
MNIDCLPYNTVIGQLYRNSAVETASAPSRVNSAAELCYKNRFVLPGTDVTSILVFICRHLILRRADLSMHD